MGEKSRQKRERRMVKAAMETFGPEIESQGYQRGFEAGILRAGECKTIAEVRKLAAPVVDEAETVDA